MFKHDFIRVSNHGDNEEAISCRPMEGGTRSALGLPRLVHREDHLSLPGLR